MRTTGFVARERLVVQWNDVEKTDGRISVANEGRTSAGRFALPAAPSLIAGAAFVYAWSHLTGSIAETGAAYNLWNTVVPLLVAFFWRPLSRRDVQKRFVVAMAAVGFVGTALIVGAPRLPEAFSVVGGSLRSISAASLTLVWLDLLSRLPLGRMCLAFGLMQVCVALLYGLFVALPYVTVYGGAVALPVMAAMCLFMSWSAMPEKPPAVAAIEKPSLRRDLRFPFVCAAFFFAFAYGLSQDKVHISSNIISYGIAGAIIVVFVLAFREKTSIHSLFKMAFPLVFVGLVLGMLLNLGSAFASSMVVNVGYALMTALLTMVLADRRARFGLSLLWSLGIVRAVLTAGVFLGARASAFVLEASSQDAFALKVLVVAALAALVVSAWLWTRDSRPNWSDLMISKLDEQRLEADAKAEDRAKADAVKEEIKRRCEGLAEEFKLSRRECEVLGYLALGWSAPRIEAELCISNNTVKTHIKHIYAKLGVHSRDEVKVLVGIDAF